MIEAPGLGWTRSCNLGHRPPPEALPLAYFLWRESRFAVDFSFAAFATVSLHEFQLSESAHAAALCRIRRSTFLSSDQLDSGPGLYAHSGWRSRICHSFLFFFCSFSRAGPVDYLVARYGGYKASFGDRPVDCSCGVFCCLLDRGLAVSYWDRTDILPCHAGPRTRGMSGVVAPLTTTVAWTPVSRTSELAWHPV